MWQMIENAFVDCQSTGIDFLRLTRVKELNRERFIAPLREAVRGELEEGYQKLPYRIYTMKGFRVGHAAGGESPSHLMAEYRGYLADNFYPFYQTVDCKATRIDLALNVWTVLHMPNIAEVAYNWALRHVLRENPEGQRRRQPTLYKSTGDTLYLGSRSSQRFLRVYNKEAQSGEPYYENCWRFEVEIKGALCQVIWEAIQAGESVQALAFGEIAHVLRSYGLAIDDITQGQQSKSVPVHRVAPDIVRRLSWMQRQVAPSLKKLMDAGFGDAALAALGLEPPPTVTDVTVE